jgi:hypothetical protein
MPVSKSEASHARAADSSLLLIVAIEVRQVCSCMLMNQSLQAWQ